MRSGRLNRIHKPRAVLSQPSDDRTLRFLEDGTFQITVFSDLHVAEDEDSPAGPLKDAKTSGVMKKVLERENSQLVVLNGDLISGYGTRADNSTLYLDQVVAPIVERGLPWATTYGNHDNEAYVRSAGLLHREQEYEGSLTRNMMPDNPQAGVSNYFLLVYPASGDEDGPETILWFFDSRGGGEPRDWIDDSVVDWFKEASANLTQQYNKTIPSLAFFHIPITAMYEFQEDPGVEPRREPGIDGEKVWWQGRGFDGKTGHDVSFMQALADTNGLLATFSGHDHDNDWCYKWIRPTTDQAVVRDGVSVCYGRHTGYGSYGDLPRGGRQILLRQETLLREAITWIRLEDGSVLANVTLNSTYGYDEYQPLHRGIELRGGVFDGVAGSRHIVPGFHSVALFLFLVVYAPFALWS